MIPSSLPVIIATAAITLLGAFALFWAWRRGFLSDLDAQSRIIFEPRDWRLARPWETADQRLDRELRHGSAVPPDRGEWGGAA